MSLRLLLQDISENLYNSRGNIVAPITHTSND